MGPAILLCPSSSAAHLWRHTTPASKPRQKEGIFSAPSRCLVSAGDRTSRRPSYVRHVPSPESRRKHFAWRRVRAASASSEVFVENAVAEGAVAVSEADHAMAGSVLGVGGEEKDAVDEEKNGADVEQGVADAQKSSPVEDIDQDVVDATQNIVDAAESVFDAVPKVDDKEQHAADAEQGVVDAMQSVGDVEQHVTDAEQDVVAAGPSVGDGEQNVADAEQEVVDAGQSVGHAEQDVVAAGQSVGDAGQSVSDAGQTVTDLEQTTQDAVEGVVSETASIGAVSPSTTAEAAPATNTEGTPVAAEKTQPRRALSRSNSKKNIVVSPAELVAGAQFAGKVVSIQSFGAFVDFGAFTNGLVHISRLSRSFVQKVEDVVQVGQDVKVQLLEVDFEAKRISLMLLQEAEQENQTEEANNDGKAPSERPQQQMRTPRREPTKRAPSPKSTSTTMKVGEVVSGFVKNIIKSGVFISLPDGTDGYLPVQEVIFKGQNTSLDAQFHVGEEISVRVVRVERGRVNLSMRKEVDFDKINADLNKDVLVTGTNPFELAFRKNEVIASYLAERDKLRAQAEVKEAESREQASIGSE